MRHFIHTVPKSSHKKFSSYVKSIESSTHNYYNSRHAPKVGKGSKSYLVHDGHMKGYIHVTGKPFHSKTGLKSPHKTYKSPPGFYTPRANKVHHIKHTPMKGFQGYRYKT